MGKTQSEAVNLRPQTNGIKLRLPSCSERLLPLPKVTYCTFRLSPALRCKLQQAEGSLKNKELLRKDPKNGFGKGSPNSPGRGGDLLEGGSSDEDLGLFYGREKD